MVATYERVVVDPPPDVNISGPLRACTPSQVAEIRRLHAAGASPVRLAATYQVAVRTIYRYLGPGERLTLGPRTLARRHGLTPSRISQIRLGTPDDGWVAACMEPDEWSLWLERNPRALGRAAIANRPCTDCPLGFAAEMRAIGRCNGSPGAIGGRHEEEDDEEDPVIDSRPSGGVRGATPLELTPPPCETCLHEPICVLKVALARAKTAEVAVAPLPDGLSVAVSARVDCRFYNRVKAPKVVRNWSPESREAARQRAIANPPRRAAS